ncbi:MAG: flavodoxin family protein [Planctomycetota bacterium]|jgi:multimeric flavodoxin WrbA
MSIKVLGISASPRVDGNSDLLLRQALAGAESAAAEAEYVRLCDLNIVPCTECNFCYESGKCRIEDDYQTLLSKILEADRMIFATPIFFMTVCAQAKILIDRCQCLWAHKFILKQPLITTGQDRRAMVIAVGGTKSKKMFDSIRLTFRYYLNVLEMRYAASLFVNQVDALGEIRKHPSAMDHAFRLGHELATVAGDPQEPVNVELT